MGNAVRRRLDLPDVFSEVVRAGGVTGAVTHSFWSEFFNRYPFDPVRDIEYDEPGGPITHGRFHTMTGDSSYNQMTPSDADLFATLTRLCEVKGIDYGLLHTCTLDSMGHRYFHDCEEMDDACYRMDEMLAGFLPRWRKAGYDVVVTADHGQDARGHHGGAGEAQQEFAFYYFGDAVMPEASVMLDQLALAPSILRRMGVGVPLSMKAEAFMKG